MEHEERPKVLNELGKKIQLLMKAVEAYKNKVKQIIWGMNCYGCLHLAVEFVVFKKKPYRVTC